MLVIVVSGAPPSLRGRLSLWLLEVDAGVYVGDYSVRTRDEIWREVVDHIGDGRATMVHRSSGESGTEISTLGNGRRHVVDVDGFQVVRFAFVDAS